MSSRVRWTTSLRFTRARSPGPLRAKVRRFRTIRPARSACSWITCRWSRSLGPSSCCSSRNSASPAIEVSGLFSSCATPDTSWPTAASFSLWMSCASIACWSVTSSTSTTRPRPGPAPPIGAALRRRVRRRRSERATSAAACSPRRAAASSSVLSLAWPTRAGRRPSPTPAAPGPSSGCPRDPRPRSPRPGMHPVHQLRRCVPGVAAQREPLAPQRAGYETGIVPPDRLPLERTERPFSRRHAQLGRLALLLDRERQQRAAGIEEAGGVAHHLAHDAVELQRLGEHVGELLEGEELGQPPVQLVRRAPALPLALRHPAPQRSRPPREPRRDEQRRRGDQEGERSLDQWRRLLGLNMLWIA